MEETIEAQGGEAPKPKEDEGWKKILNHVLDNIHNRLTYGTAERKKAIEDAAGEPEEPRDYVEGFKKAKEKY